MHRTLSVLAALLVLAARPSTAAEQLRSFTPDDIDAIREVDDPQLSPDGNWVAYTVRETDAERDEFVTHVWMTSWDGKQTVQLTRSDEGDSEPRWSPDGQSLAFLSSRGDDDAPAQLWLLPRAGGEPRALTTFKGDVLDYAWSPDGKKIALVVMDEDPNKVSDKDKDEDQTPPPIVIDRYYFKEDGTGYLGALRHHLYVLDVATSEVVMLTAGVYDESQPAWSPDGSKIAFVSKRGADPDRSTQTGLYTITPGTIEEPHLVTTFAGIAGDTGDVGRPVWRPDGGALAFVGMRDEKLIYYATQELVVAPLDGTPARMVSADLDRNVSAPKWSADGKSLYTLLEDDRNQHLVRINAASGKVDRLLTGRRETAGFDLGSKNRIVLLDGTVDRPNEVFALEGGKERRLTHQNDAWLDGLEVAPVSEISFDSKDGTRIDGFLALPPGYEAGKRYPTLLSIHGGPTSQFANAFDLEWQILASQGYVIVAANPRGSTGRGEEFAKAIWAEWGGKDAEDVLAAVDYAVREGFADPDRLGVGGWSYGGILTDVVIAKSTRFKAAVSGASIGNALAGYGTDMYVREYEREFGTPWHDTDVYLRNSYPFLHADRIETPTLFLCGEDDFNVPLLNSEQMYEALKSLGVDTELVIYPGQHHHFEKPSYERDRMWRYVAWYAKYLEHTGDAP